MKYKIVQKAYIWLILEDCWFFNRTTIF